jgi:glycosyltransferase involved in cell wall biosynthesis
MSTDELQCAFVSFVDLSVMDGRRAHILGFGNALARQLPVVMVNPTMRDVVTDANLDYVQLRYPKRKIPMFSYSKVTIDCLSCVNRQRRLKWIYIRSTGTYLDLVTLLWAKARGLTAVLEVNGLLKEEYLVIAPQSGWGWRTKFLINTSLVFLRISCRIASRIVAVTEGIRSHLIKDYGIEQTRIGVFSNGVDTIKFHPLDRDACKAELGLISNARYVGFIGSLMPWQGIDDFIIAFCSIISNYPDVNLLVVGDGKLKGQLQSLVRELDLDGRVLFVGQISHDDIPKYINACDIVTSPKKPLISGYSPMKVYEYLACGRPVLASHLPGLEFLQLEGVGATFRAEDTEDLARALAELMALSPSDWQIMSVKARKIAVERFSWDVIVGQVKRFAVS